MNEFKICASCEEGHMHPDVRDVEVSRKGIKRTVSNIAGLFCDKCDEIFFDESTDSAARYAAVGDELVLAARKVTAERLKKARVSLKLTQAQASVISGGGHNAFSRYETGAAQPLPAVVNLFTLLESHPEMLSELDYDTRMAV